MSSKTSFLQSRTYPWLVISLCAAFLFYKYVLQVSPSIMTHDLMSEFHLNGTGLGNLAATFFYSYIIMQLFVGILLDKYSPRLLVSIAILVAAIGAFGFAHSHNLLEASLTRALMGLGVAFATVGYMKMTAVWFKPNQFAFVGGLLGTAAMLGAVFGQAPLSLVVTTVNWRNTLLLVALLGLIIAILFFLVTRDRNPNHVEQYSLRAAFSWQEVWDVMRSKQNWLLTIFGGLLFEPVAVFGGLWGNPYIEQVYNLSNTQAASLISLSFIGFAIGSPVLGLASDRIGQRKPVLFGGTLLALVSFLLAVYVPLNPVWSGIWIFLFGFSAGSYMLVFALARDTNKLTLAATVAAMINTGDAILGAVTEPLLGKFLDLRWTGVIQNGTHYFSVSDYRFALGILPLYLVFGLVTLWFVKENKVKA